MLSTNCPRIWENSAFVHHLCSLLIGFCCIREAQIKILTRMYNRTTPEEQRWIVRIILKGLLTFPVSFNLLPSFRSFMGYLRSAYT